MAPSTALTLFRAEMVEEKYVQIEPGTILSGKQGIERISCILFCSTSCIQSDIKVYLTHLITACVGVVFYFEARL